MLTIRIACVSFCLGLSAAAQSVSVGADQTVSHGSPASLNGVTHGLFEWWTGDGKINHVGALVMYRDDTGTTYSSGPMSNGTYQFGWPADFIDVNLPGLTATYGFDNSGPNTQYLYTIVNPTTGSVAIVSPGTASTATNVHSLAWDGSSNFLYAIDQDSKQLLKIDLATGVFATPVTILQDPMHVGEHQDLRGLAWAGSNTLYAVNNKTVGANFAITLNTLPSNTSPNAQLTQIATITAPGTGMRIDELEYTCGILYGVLADGPNHTAQLVEINPSTGALTNIGPLVSEVAGHALGLKSVIRSYAWSNFVGPNGGTVSFTTPNAPSTSASFSLPGKYTLRLTVVVDGPLTGCSQVFTDELDVVSETVGWSFCAGDGSLGVAACPCGNASTSGSGAGCRNSTLALTGAVLSNAGSNDLSNNDTVLFTTGLPLNKSGFTYLSTQPHFAGGVFGVGFDDGIKCLDFPTRLSVQTSTAGTFTYNGLPPLGLAGGDTRYFQTWHRDSAVWCNQQANFSNALAITFVP